MWDFIIRRERKTSASLGHYVDRTIFGTEAMGPGRPWLCWSKMHFLLDPERRLCAHDELQPSRFWSRPCPTLSHCVTLASHLASLSHVYSCETGMVMQYPWKVANLEEAIMKSLHCAIRKLILMAPTANILPCESSWVR